MSTSIFRRGLPGQTADLIRQLDKEVRPAEVLDPAALADPKRQLELARLYGRRELVDDLVKLLKRNTEDATK